MTLVAPGIYRDGKGQYYERPWLHGRRTWRKLHSRTLAQAKTEVQAKRSDHRRAQLGLADDPYNKAKAKTVGDLASEYLLAGCPGRSLAARVDRQLAQEKARITKLLPFWRHRQAASIRPKDIGEYYQKRKAEMTGKRKTPVHGGRAIDLELSTLSNVCAWATALGKIPANPMAGPRPKFRSKTVRHCRDVMPQDADELHSLARHLFDEPRSCALGWQLLLEAFTGCRTSEILRLRLDATHRGQAGYVEGDWLWLHRSKSGVNPFADVHEALKQCLAALRLWHQQRNARLAKRGLKPSPWWIPGREHGAPMSIGSLTRALRDAARLLGQPHRTSHGLRAYYVTVRRSQGISDAQIAAEIGDRTGPTIISTTYGDIPPNWHGAEGLTWLPSEGAPAWSVFGFPANAVAFTKNVAP